MLQWFRARAPRLAAALLVWSVTLGASAVAHDDRCHGALCVVSVAPHDASDHSIRTPAPADEHTQQCVVCQWTRLLRPSIDAVRVFSPHSDGNDRVSADPVRVPPVFPAAQPPLRSPPIAPALFV
jgi:hypothetical protein